MDLMQYAARADIYILLPQQKKFMQKVTTPEIFDGVTKTMHEQGLYSYTIFGRPASAKRFTTFAYIDLGTKVLVPKIAALIMDYKQLYKEIMEGRTYAVWNDEIKDFEKSNVSLGDTGFGFFMSHVDEIKFVKNNSKKRNKIVEVLEKYQGNWYMDALLVIPAGLRDIRVNENGTYTEDEINAYYRFIISQANSINSQSFYMDSELVQNIRKNIQFKIVELYKYIINLVKGKRGFAQSKFATRRIFDTTRNVLSSAVRSVTSMDDPRNITVNHTTVGLYQMARAAYPKIIHHITSGFMSEIFKDPDTPATLIDRKTLKAVQVPIDTSIYNMWMTGEGILDRIKEFGRKALRHQPILVGDHYLALVYKDFERGYVKVVHGLDDVPDEFKNSGTIEPMTLAEFFYLNLAPHLDKYACYVTRYPVTGIGSIYPSYVYLKTTVKSHIVKLLDDGWQETDIQLTEYPIRDETFFDTLAPSNAHLKRLGADFDGDTGSFTCVQTEDALKEVEAVLGSREFYVDSNNKMYFSSETDVSELTLLTLTAGE